MVYTVTTDDGAGHSRTTVIRTLNIDYDYDTSTIYFRVVREELTTVDDLQWHN